jgi:hypothetical protein
MRQVSSRGREVFLLGLGRAAAGALLKHVLVVVSEAAGRASRLQELGESRDQIEVPRAERFCHVFQLLPEGVRAPRTAASL